MKQLPDKYAWLNKEPAPCMLLEALKHYGTLEHVGKGSEPNILSWAKEVGVSGWYTDDDIPWCGLFIGVVVKRCGYPIKSTLLSAISWKTFGHGVERSKAELWDILVFKRTGGGHVGFYVGENEYSFLVYGGNQSNAVGFAWVAKNRLIAVRKPVYKIGEPDNIRKIFLSETGEFSTNEA